MSRTLLLFHHHLSFQNTASGRIPRAMSTTCPTPAAGLPPPSKHFLHVPRMLCLHPETAASWRELGRIVLHPSDLGVALVVVRGRPQRVQRIVRRRVRVSVRRRSVHLHVVCKSRTRVFASVQFLRGVALDQQGFRQKPGTGPRDCPIDYC